MAHTYVPLQHEACDGGGPYVWESHPNHKA
jgi:hypothetical protein